MKTLLLTVVAAFLGIATASAYSDYIYGDQPLVLVTFDHLIPTSCPTIQADFNNLIPTTCPLIDSGISTVHITENLIHPTDQPLLIVDHD